MTIDGSFPPSNQRVVKIGRVMRPPQSKRCFKGAKKHSNFFWHEPQRRFCEIMLFSFFYDGKVKNQKNYKKKGNKTLAFW